MSGDDPDLEKPAAPPSFPATHLREPKEGLLFDSDEEVEEEWSAHIAAPILAGLSDPQKKRQEIINEIYRTERNHVRTLRLLEQLFQQPLDSLNGELSQLLFPPSLLILRDLHSRFEGQLKQRRVEHNAMVGDLGDLLLGTVRFFFD